MPQVIGGTNGWGAAAAAARPTPAVQDATSIFNRCTVVDSSVKFDATSKMLAFTIRCTAACQVEMHSFVRTDIRSGHVLISPNRPKAPPPALPCGADIAPDNDANNPYTYEWSLQVEDFDAAADHERRFVPEYQKQIPVVISLRYVVATTSTAPGVASKQAQQQHQVEHTLIALQPTCRVIKQVLEANGNAYLMEHLFGAENHHVEGSPSTTGPVAVAGEVVEAAEGEEDVCVVCLTNPKDTAAIPCRHMCVCKECAVTLRTQVPSKCPMCRKEVTQYVTLKQPTSSPAPS